MQSENTGALSTQSHTTLRPHRMVFAMHFLASGDGVDAARKTGYSNPYSASFHLLKRVDVQKMIKAFRAHNIAQLAQQVPIAMQRTEAKAVTALCAYLNIEFEPDGATIRFKEPEELPNSALQDLVSWHSDDDGRVTAIQLRHGLDSLIEMARLADIDNVGLGCA